MIRIGIIGTENSHAAGFSRYIKSSLSDRARVVGLMGDGAEALAEEIGADFVAVSPEDFVGKVDAMMVTSRRGSEHYKYIAPFVRMGMPVFVDKPFTSDPEEAKQLIAEIEKSGSLVLGGSGCKFAADVQKIKQRVAELREKGELRSASITFNVIPDSIYDGFWFYAAHLVEITLEIFGRNFDDMQVVPCGKHVVVTLSYGDEAIVMTYVAGTSKYACSLYGKSTVDFYDISISDIMAKEGEHFVEMIETGKMPAPASDYLLPVELIAKVVEKLNK